MNEVESIAADKILKCFNNNKKLFRLPPPLKEKANLVEFLSFYFKYYSDNSMLSLKNASRQITFAKISISKTHLWLQSVAYALRVSLLIEGNSIQYISNFFRVHAEKGPLVLKSALQKYKYWSIPKWSDNDFNYCCVKELESVQNKNMLPGFVSNKLTEYLDKQSMFDNLKELLFIADQLESEGNYALSEKILNSAETLTGTLRYI